MSPELEANHLSQQLRTGALPDLPSTLSLTTQPLPSGLMGCSCSLMAAALQKVDMT